MKKILSLAFALLAAAAPAMAAPPAPKIVVLDRNMLLQSSSVGQDTAKQLQALSGQISSGLEGQRKALAAEGEKLRQEVAILGPDARRQKEEAFQAKVRGATAAAERRQLQLQQAAGQAQQSIAKALEPIINEIVKARGANMVVDKGAVIFATSDAFDITREAIAKLNAQMPTLKVSLGGAPAK